MTPAGHLTQREAVGAIAIPACPARQPPSAARRTTTPGMPRGVVKMAAVEHVVVDAGAFLRAAPLQVAPGRAGPGLRGGGIGAGRGGAGWG